jgi:molybdopterin-guanine dinucleotide biosynthesis protein A
MRAAYRLRMDPLAPFTAVVLAGGKAARLGGRAKPQLDVGGRTMLAAVLAAVAGADRRIVVGPPQPVPDGVVLVREEPPGGGPVTALRTGLAAVATEVVAVLAGDLPFLTTDLVDTLRAELRGDVVLVVDDGGRDQLLLALWRTASLRRALRSAPGPAPVRRLLTGVDVDRIHPTVEPGRPAPWLDCDTPTDLARARQLADPPAG